MFLESSLILQAEERKNRLLETAIAAQGTSESIKKAAESLGGK